MKMLPSKKLQQGFTLIELLIVITIIAALAVSVFVALNPAKRVQDANNARRQQDVDSILSAIHTYIVDNNGTMPTGLSSGMSETQLGSSGTGCDTPTNCGAVAACVDLSTPLASYLKSIPFDPVTGSATKTRYSVAVDSNGIVTVKSCDPQGSATISESR